MVDATANTIGLGVSAASFAENDLLDFGVESHADNGKIALRRQSQAGCCGSHVGVGHGCDRPVG